MTLAATSSFDRNRPAISPHWAEKPSVRRELHIPERDPEERVSHSRELRLPSSLSTIFPPLVSSRYVPHSSPLALSPLSSRGEQASFTGREGGRASIRLSPCRPDSWDSASNPTPRLRATFHCESEMLSHRVEALSPKEKSRSIQRGALYRWAHAIVDVWNARGGRGNSSRSDSRLEDFSLWQSGSTRRRSSRIWTIGRSAPPPTVDFNLLHRNDVARTSRIFFSPKIIAIFPQFYVYLSITQGKTNDKFIAFQSFLSSDIPTSSERKRRIIVYGLVTRYGPQSTATHVENFLF